MAYNYLEAVKDDVKQAIENNYDVADYSDREEFEATLNEELWTDDSVTGNGSGSYTFNREQAKEYLFDSNDGLNLLRDAVSDYAIDAETVVDHFMSEDWEWFDVTIRCYVLGQAISEALDEIEDDLGRVNSNDRSSNNI